MFNYSFVIAVRNVESIRRYMRNCFHR